MKLIITLILALLIVPLSVIAAAPLPTTVSATDQATFDQILQPVFKIYNFVKYIASVVAGIFLLYAGIAYMSSGTDPKRRDQAKNIAMYSIIGLIVIWAAPFIVGLLI